MPLYRRVESNAQLTEFRCVEFVEELIYGHLRKQPGKYEVERKLQMNIDFSSCERSRFRSWSLADGGARRRPGADRPPRRRNGRPAKPYARHARRTASRTFRGFGPTPPTRRWSGRRRHQRVLHARGRLDEVKRRGAARESEQTEPGTVADVHYDFTQFGLDRSQGELARNLRTSLIVDPPERCLP